MRWIIPASVGIVAFLFLLHDIFKTKNKLSEDQIKKNIAASKISKV